MKAKTKAVMTLKTGGISIVKYGLSSESAGFVTDETLRPAKRCGKTTVLVAHPKSPEEIVDTYAIAAVTASHLPAPLPNSEMAGVISPTIINGIMKDRKFPKTPLKVTKTRVNS